MPRRSGNGGLVGGACSRDGCGAQNQSPLQRPPTGSGAFISDGLTYDATLRNLELIGEAATRIPKAVREKNPDIPWRMIIATRNRLIHAYLGIDDDTVWSIIQKDIPGLLSALKALKR